MKFKKQKYDKNIRIEFDTMKVYVPKKKKFKFVSAERRYNYDAYIWCERKCELFMKRDITPIAVANTFVKEAHLKSYYELAEKYGYRVFCVVMENRSSTINVHNVPDEALEKQARKFKIKLI